MNEHGKPPGMPSQATVDNAREALERAQFKLGRAQTKAIISSAQAGADKDALDEAQAERDKAEAELVAIVKRFTGRDFSLEASLEAVRSKMADVTASRQVEAPTGGGVVPILPAGETPPLRLVEREALSAPPKDSAKEGLDPAPIVGDLPGESLSQAGGGLFGEQNTETTADGKTVDVVVAHPMGPHGPKLEIKLDRPELSQGSPLERPARDWGSQAYPPVAQARDGDQWHDTVLNRPMIFQAGAWVLDEAKIAAAAPKGYWPEGDAAPEAKKKHPFDF